MPTALSKPIVCYVTDRKALGPPDPVRSLLGSIRAAITAGADWVQIREKDLPARPLLALARQAIAAASAAADAHTKKIDDSSRAGPAQVWINGRLDVALAAGAAGVHLGGESAPAHDVIGWCRSGNAPPGFLIGISCHSLQSARLAESAGASCIFFGPVFDTPSKESFGPPQGISRLAEVCSALRIPVIAIGGVNEDNGAKCFRVGAAGVAAIQIFQKPRNPGALKIAMERLHGLG